MIGGIKRHGGKKNHWILAEDPIRCKFLNANEKKKTKTDQTVKGMHVLL